VTLQVIYCDEILTGQPVFAHLGPQEATKRHTSGLSTGVSQSKTPRKQGASAVNE
jgi:hypothetical protein